MLLVTLATNLIVLLVCNQQLADAWWLFADHQHQSAPSGSPIAKAVANFDLDGVRGAFRFTQKSANEPTVCEYDLRGLKGNNKLFHVHVRPVPAHNPDLVRNNATAVAALCGDPATGGHLNPHHITAKLPPKSAPLDQYEIGDLSGKFGPMVQAADDADHYVGTFTDNHLPLTGEHGIVGRSIVIHKNDGKRWVCANIIEAK